MQKILAVILTSCLLLQASPAAAQKGFCSLEEAVDQLMDAAGVLDHADDPILRDYAEEIIAKKFLPSPESPDLPQVRIEWADIYELRGLIATTFCTHPEKYLYHRTDFKDGTLFGFMEEKIYDAQDWAKVAGSCTGGVVDALGKGLFGTKTGKVLAGTGLFISGPVGAIAIGSMITAFDAAKEAHQCDPSALAIGLTLGTGALFLLPWCRFPGVKSACSAAGRVFRARLAAIARRIFAKGPGARVIGEAEEAVFIEAGEEAVLAVGAKNAPMGREAASDMVQVSTLRIPPPAKKPATFIRGATPKGAATPVMRGSGHAGGETISLEEQSLQKEGAKLILWNPRSGNDIKFSYITGRPEPPPGGVIFQVRPDGVVRDVAWGDGASAIPKEAVEGARKLADSIRNMGKLLKKEPIPVHDLSEYMNP
ncbi:MAG: hypothetical protein A2X36_13885 [Elusimicrobia bacterium GWA2_69_24]|nr:MAG: hypothetical protein A2X36_13885 [Elusimicrobia bacterium GWA2_69_24]HBL16711.1 hypothetical protein [Elusimicrobiota bacterium]